MNLNNATPNDYANLIRSADDRLSNRIWVNTKGDVFCDQVVAGQYTEEWLSSKPDIKFYYEMFVAGNGYVGTKAANDVGYVNDYTRKLIENWKDGLTGFVDY